MLDNCHTCRHFEEGACTVSVIPMEPDPGGKDCEWEKRGYIEEKDRCMSCLHFYHPDKTQHIGECRSKKSYKWIVSLRNTCDKHKHKPTTQSTGDETHQT